MSKILFQHKETLVVVFLGLVLLVVLTINTALLLPTVIRVYSPSQKTVDQSPIDVATVNQAIEYLGQ